MRAPKTFPGVKMGTVGCNHSGEFCNCRKLSYGAVKPHLTIAKDDNGDKYWVALIRDRISTSYHAWAAVGKTPKEAMREMAKHYPYVGNA